MKIARHEYSINTRSYDIYVSGCSGPHCEGCHNPELWDFKAGKDYTYPLVQKIINKIKENDSLIDRVFIMGGEPLDQYYESIRHLCRVLHFSGKDVYLFTGKDFKDVPHILCYWVDFIKCGRYEKEKIGYNCQYGIELASVNQEIHRKGIDF
jgi:anaerobic ribonucleoside-triphosphate reductase activating protein